MHDEAREWCSRYQSLRHGIGLDVGGRDVNGTSRDLWPNMTWSLVDIFPDTPADVDPSRIHIADARIWEPDQKYDLVLCTEVLEHVKEWQRVIWTMVRALVPGGLMIITTAGISRPPHSMYGEMTLSPEEHYENIHGGVLQQELDSHGMNHVINVQKNDVRAAVWFSGYGHW